MQKRKKAQDSAAAQAKAAQQHTRLALEGDETVVGIGVDAFLPPSTYTIPVKFQSGVPFAALAFGCCDNDQATKPVSAVLQEKSTPSEQTGYGGETELETAWQNEARDLQLLSSAVTKELKRRRGDTVVEYPLHNDQIKQRAIDIIGTAEVGVKRLRAAVETAEAAAKQQHLDTDQGSVEEMVDDNEDEGGSVYNDDPLACNETLNETGNPLICSEILPPPKKTKMSDKAARELTVLAYQDEALLKELTAIVKERTLELAKIRKKRNEELV
mmetsp:Transcript_6661/g.9582  ORF Transcript_6661/g.9582 Transcript_6661/m.9582 type:complete len:271 (+) Transcript_6661:362-1174(+)